MSDKKEQVLHWSPEAKVTITGLEFDVFQKMVGILEQYVLAAVAVRGQIWERMIQEGLVKTEDEEVYVPQKEEVQSQAAEEISEHADDGITITNAS